MCLDTVTKTYDTPKKMNGVGYKGFNYIYKTDDNDYYLRDKNGNAIRRDDIIEPPCFGPTLPTGTWVEPHNDMGIIASDGTNYRSGFHILLSKKAAREWGSGLHKVKFTDVVAEGMQDEHKCVVARKIFICKKEIK